MRINIGSIARWKGDCDVLVSPDYIVFRCIDDHETGISADYLDQFRGSLQWEKFVSGSGDGGVRIRIYYKDLALLSMGLPSLPEQRKIASCLASLDELIGEQGRKVDALRTHKKGLMQKLFPREGETQPQLRFPEFQDEDHWKYITLGDIAEIKLGKMLDKQKNKAGHLLPYLNNISVRWNEVNTTDLPQMYFDDTELDRFGLMAGDVVVCEGGEPGRAAVWDGRLPNVKFQKAIHRVRFTVPFEPKLFVLHLENLAGTNQFEMLFTGGGIKHLTRETFSQLRVPLISIREQQRIATCLSSLDDLITAETQKLEALKTHKRGLMQQMFPSQEEA
jgi:type I restriction enzyme S subunit